jgi:phospholipase/carboxylesterase
MDDNLKSLQIDRWKLRLRRPQGEGPHPTILMLHGWTGDENSMWIFASRLPSDALLIAPRGRFPTPLGGYGWQPEDKRRWPEVDDLRPAIDDLLQLLTPANFPDADLDNFSLVGFSQGAALSYTFSLLHPLRIHQAAGLSGFLPKDAGRLIENAPLKGKRLFAAHGTQDNMVPVERARSAVDLLEKAGAKVTYCEDDVGHKLSLTCFKALQNFFAT